MARVTVEDCKLFPSRFELVIMAVRLANHFASGALIDLSSQASESIGRPPLHDPLAKKEEKYSVRALREIAAGNIDPDAARAELLDHIRSKHKALFASAMEEQAVRTIGLLHGQQPSIDTLFDDGVNEPSLMHEEEILLVGEDADLLDDEIADDLVVRMGSTSTKESDEHFSFEDDNIDVDD